MNHAFRSSFRRALLCSLFGVISARTIIVMAGGKASPVTLSNYVAYGILVAIFVSMVEKIYSFFVRDVNPDKEIVYIQKEEQQDEA